MLKKEKERIAELGKKAVDIGLGLVSITEKKAREAAAELVRRGEIKREETEQFIDKLLRRTEKERKGLEERIGGVVKKVIEKLPLATRKEVDELKKKLNNLEKKI